MTTVVGGTESEGVEQEPQEEERAPVEAPSPHPGPRGEMPFLDHLEELRWRIFKAGGALFASFFIGFAGVHYLDITELLIRPIRPYLTNGRLAAFSPTTPFFLEIKLALIVGLVLSFPVIVYQVWAFVAPGLELHEKKVVVPSLYMGLVLFAAGVAMAYWLALPLSLKFLFSFQVEYLTPTIGANEYLSFVVRLLVSFGAIFELPVVIMILSSLGLVTPTFLRQKRRHAVVVITVVAAILSPGDVIGLTLLMMIPLIALYELSIILSHVVWRRREERERAIGGEPPEGVEAAE